MVRQKDKTIVFRKQILKFNNYFNQLKYVRKELHKNGVSWLNTSSYDIGSPEEKQ